MSSLPIIHDVSRAARRAGPSGPDPRGSALRLLALIAALLSPSLLPAQQPANHGATVEGRVYLANSTRSLALVEVGIEGTGVTALTDTAGRYRLVGVPGGTQTLVARRIGYAVVRTTIVVPDHGTVTRDVAMAVSALNLPEITVTAQAQARAKGELGTASVIDRDAIANQTASSLSGVLELVPGVELQPPGLGGVQQFSLRSIPTTTAVGLTAGGPSAADIASFGTSIVLDGVPVSNNANLQTLGSRGELNFLIPSTAGGGVDLRQIPAATLERVEVIRGIPSARYGDLTEGVIVVDTRAGIVPPSIRTSFDPNTLEASFVGGRALGRRHTLTVTGDVAHTQIDPGVSDDDALRFTGQIEHHVTLGGTGREGGGGLQLDTRIRTFLVDQNNPVQPDVHPGQAATNHDRGFSANERLTLGREGGTRFTVTASLDQTRRQSTAQQYLIRGASPFTNALTAGTDTGFYVIGSYLAKVRLDGNEWNLYDRMELEHPMRFAGFDQIFRAGAELRQAWNTGAGYQFDIQYPPQVTFNGVQGYDRPRTFSAVPPLVTSSGYLDDRLHSRMFGMDFEVQAGLRADLLHDGSSWFSGVRDAVLQPRLNAELVPLHWLRLRAGYGTTAKTPALGDLFPAPQYFDVVNVNYYANNPAERLAVLTTDIRDPTNPSLGFSVGHKSEVGFEIANNRGDAALSVVAFRDRTTGGVGIFEHPSYVLRNRYALDTTVAGKPPVVLEPPVGTDTMPVLIDEPANVLTLESHGYEGTLTLPELKPLHLTLAVQGAWTATSFFQNGPDFGRNFTNFQLDPAVPRAPYWASVTRKAQRAVMTYRLVHHQPRLGLVVTAVVEHIFSDQEQDVAATDTLAFDGYVTRDGTLVPVPASVRGQAQYADLRIPRSGQFLIPTTTPADWMLSVQVAKTLPLEGELRFSAFNVLDRLGRVLPRAARVFPRLSFGLEVTMPLAGILPVGYQGP